jgi:glycosyltransferase Alg8
MRLGYDTFYVPDAAINTVEHPPEKSFLKASRKLMYRWYGNNLRQNSRALGLGVNRLGVFTSVVLFDQRVSMWTSILGLTVALIASFKYGVTFLLMYLLWIGITRLVLTLLLSCSGHSIGPAYPVILYYNQIVGALMKIYMASFQGWFNTWSSRTMTFSAGSIFVAVLLTMV